MPSPQHTPQATVYANHAGTSWPKPELVRAAVAECLGADPATFAERLAADHAAVAAAFGVTVDRLRLCPGGVQLWRDGSGALRRGCRQSL